MYTQNRDLGALALKGKIWAVPIPTNKISQEPHAQVVQIIVLSNQHFNQVNFQASIVQMGSAHTLAYQLQRGFQEQNFCHPKMEKISQNLFMLGTMGPIRSLLLIS